EVLLRARGECLSLFVVFGVERSAVVFRAKFEQFVDARDRRVVRAQRFGVSLVQRARSLRLLRDRRVSGARREAERRSRLSTRLLGRDVVTVGGSLRSDLRCQLSDLVLL